MLSSHTQGIGKISGDKSVGRAVSRLGLTSREEREVKARVFTE